MPGRLDRTIGSDTGAPAFRRSVLSTSLTPFRMRARVELPSRAARDFSWRYVPSGISIVVRMSPLCHIYGEVAVARLARLHTLVEFLGSSDDRVQVVLSPQAREGSLTIVGDWFMAESLVPRPGEGYRQTVFSWHAPTVLDSLKRFDRQFESLMNQSRIKPHDSRRHAWATIRSIVDDLSSVTRSEP